MPALVCARKPRRRNTARAGWLSHSGACDQAIKAVALGAIDDQAREQRADPDALHVVGNLDREVGDPRILGLCDVSAHADDRAVPLVDRGERLVPQVIDVRQVRRAPAA